MKKLKMIVCAAAVMTSATALADDARTASHEAGNVAQARTSMGAAVAAAEKHAGGKAVRAEYEKGKDGRWAYDVEVAGGTDMFDVRIDADAGTVIASTKDAADSDDEGDKAD
ncbi:PepSY domain-containing protein [Tardiphaga robiniae]|uniref:Peptidase M4 n=1 Tax=Tardiphaga robiniae TaxID=943830 RepID=A0A163XPJ0_9BRAD|nr:PepSY domain-containing protein [Tardiphaga robiniae]KZD21176.1 peptidase M4 [Tardiphaga robiniae]